MLKALLSSTLLLVCTVTPLVAQVESAANAPFTNFESGEVRPLLLTPDGNRLLVLNGADHRLEVYAVDVLRERRSEEVSPRGGSPRPAPRGGINPTPSPPNSPAVPVGSIAHSTGRVRLRFLASVFTGLEPVAMALHPTESETVFVVNKVSDTLVAVDLEQLRVVETIDVGDEPHDVLVFRDRIYVPCARIADAPTLLLPGDPDTGFTPNGVRVFDLSDLSPRTVIGLNGMKPRALAEAGGLVFAIVQNSGNKTVMLSEETIVTQGLSIDQLTPDSPGGCESKPLEVNPILLGYSFIPTDVTWEIPRVGRIVCDDEFPGLTLTLDDDDLFAIDPSGGAPSLVGATKGIGTTLFNLARNPVTGKLWIVNTDSRNRIRQEYNLTGEAFRNRITIASAAAVGTVDQVIELAPPFTQEHHAQPSSISFYQGEHGAYAYVAALGTDTIVVLDATSGELVREFRTGNLPRGLAVDEEESLLYVFCRGEKEIRIYDIGKGHRELGAQPLDYDPEPPIVTRGRRHLYGARVETGHGTGNFSCASCHIDGHLDGIGWDLGNSRGGINYIYPDLASLNVLGLPPGIPMAEFTTPVFHPMKGPMTTQSLRGLQDLKNDEPLHWRGDRRFFHHFQGAFRGLLGGTGIGGEEMQEYAGFLRNMVYAPNPFQPKDRVYRGQAEDGRKVFGMNATPKDYRPGLTCIGCHEGDFAAKTDFTGGQTSINFDGNFQFFNTPQLRFLFEKDFRHLTGFGASHAGEIDGVRGFLDETLATTDFVAEAFPFHTQVDRDGVSKFVKSWDTGMAPLVGSQRKADPTDFSDVEAWLDLAEAQAEIGDLDLIGKGIKVSPSRPHGIFYSEETAGNWKYLVDNGAFLTRSELLDRIRLESIVGVFTCVPPGQGLRLGVDQDEDGLLDHREVVLGLDPAHPDTDRDGHTDGSEVTLGSNPRKILSVPSDDQAPTLVSGEVVDLFANAATGSFVTDEPVSAEVECRLNPSDALPFATFAGAGLRARHDLILTGLPAGTEIFYIFSGKDASGNEVVDSGSFTTEPPHLHIEEIELLYVDGPGVGEVTVTARVLVLDQDGQPVEDVPVQGAFLGDIGGQDLLVEFRTVATGWAELTLDPYLPVTTPMQLVFGPLFLGSNTPADPFYVGGAGDNPTFFYQEPANGNDGRLWEEIEIP